METISAQYAKARGLVSTIEFQLQQLEERTQDTAGTVTTIDEPRQTLSANINLLLSEITQLDRAIGAHFGPGIGTGQALLWQRYVCRSLSHLPFCEYRKRTGACSVSLRYADASCNFRQTRRRSAEASSVTCGTRTRRHE